jgi:hypothetical protein
MTMTSRRLAATVSILALSACGGGGGGASAPTVPGPPVVATTAPQASGTIPMSISIPRKPSSSGRSPQFLSPSVSSIAIYDGATLLYVANLALDSTPQFTTVYAKSGNSTVTFGTCTFTNSAAVCSLTVTSTVGPHKFDVIAYPTSQGGQVLPPSNIRTVLDTGTPPTFTGVISSEGELSATIVSGVNPGATLTLLGVADQVLFAGLSEAAFNSVTTYGYRIEDSTNSQIVLPGNAYDNGPVTITAAPSGIVTISPNSVATPPATVGDQNFDVTCVNASGGTVTISFNTRTSPNTAYASGLTYTTANYSGATIQTIPFTCDADTATIPVTVQSKRHS